MQLPDHIEEPEHTDVLAKTAVAQGEFQKLPKEALTAELLSAVIFWSLSTLGITGGSAGLLFSRSSRSPWFVLGIMLFWVLFTAWSFGWPVLSYRRTFYRASNLGLEIRRGVLWQKHHFVPRSRIQHSDIHQGPFQRRLGISRLTVYTAGSARHTTALTGVTMDQARAMRKMLTGHQGHDGV